MPVIAVLLFFVLAAVPLRAQPNAPAAVAIIPVVTDDPKAVLILSEGAAVPYSAGPVPPTTTVLRAGLVAALRNSPAPLNVYEEMIDRGRFDTPDYDRQLLALYKAKYSNPAPDLVIALTEPALDFVLRHRDELFPGSPLLFGAVDERALTDRPLGANVTGVFLHYDVRATLEAALALHPHTRQIVVVGGTSRLDRGYVDIAKKDVRDLASAVPITYITDQPLGAVLATLTTLPDNALVVFLSMQADGKGVARSGPEVMTELRRVTKVPIYGMSGNFLGLGMFGGMLFDNPSHAAALGQRALQILSGVPAGTLVPIASPNALKFDAREMARFGIEAAQLPPGATVINRDVGLWTSYRRPILIAGAALVGQSLLIGGLLVQRNRRRKAERGLIERQDALRQSQSRYMLATTAGAVGVWDWNLETNELFVDTVLKAILGFEDHEVSTRADDWGSRVHPEDVAASTAGIKACFDGLTDAYEVEHRMLHKDGSVRWMLSRGTAIRAADGSLRRMVGTKVDITRRKWAEGFATESKAVLRRRNEKIHELTGRLIESQEGERSRIARELHDDISQQIAGLSISLSGFKRRLAELPRGADLGRDVSSLQERVITLADNVRGLSHDLHPRVLQHAGLVPALSEYCSQIARQQPVNVTFVAEGDLESTTDGTALCIYRVVQETLRNVVTHANAGHAEVRLQRVGDTTELTIVDNGRGFDVVEAGKHASGLGLVSITERVRLAGGAMSILSEMNKGTRVHVQIPANGDALELPSA